MTAPTPSAVDSELPYAVVGATGQQGGAVVRALLSRKAPVRALVRDPEAVPDLIRLGADVVRADLDDPSTLRAAFTNVAGVFAMTTFATADGTDGEIAHGHAIADAAAAVDVPYLVYSSVGGAERATGIPHFDSKWQVEQYLRAVGVPLGVLRPTFFMDNFTSYFQPVVENEVSVLRAPLLADVPLQMIAVTDIGAAAATALLDPTRLAAGPVEIAGDELSGQQVAERFAMQAGLPARFESLSLTVLSDDDQEAMFAWFQHLPAYKADFASTRALVPDVLDLAGFVSQVAGE